MAMSLVGLFVCYGMQFLAVVSFLPTMLVEQSGFSLGTAALYSGIVAIGNDWKVARDAIIGHLV